MSLLSNFELSGSSLLSPITDFYFTFWWFSRTIIPEPVTDDELHWF